MHRGYIKLWRKIRDNEIMLNEGACQLFLWIAVSVRHEPGKEFGVDLEPGQMITGRFQLAAILKQKPSTIYSRLLWLRDHGIINTESNNQYTIITLLNWHTYNGESTTNHQRFVSDSSATRQRLGTLEELEELKNKNICPPEPPASSPKPEAPNPNKDDIDRIVGLLNNRLGTSYRTTTVSTVKALNARLKEFSADDLCLMVRHRVYVWKDDEKMKAYLTPETLFRPGNCEKYVQQAKAAEAERSKPKQVPLHLIEG